MLRREQVVKARMAARPPIGESIGKVRDLVERSRIGPGLPAIFRRCGYRRGDGADGSTPDAAEAKAAGDGCDGTRIDDPTRNAAGHDDVAFEGRKRSRFRNLAHQTPPPASP